MRRKRNYKNCFLGEKADEKDEIGSRKIETKSSFNL